MIPSRQLYLLLLLGTVPGLLLASVGPDFSQPQWLGLAILLVLIWDGIVLLLAVLDALQVTGDRVQVSRNPLQRLSIGRENPVELVITADQRSAVLQIRDDYPPDFASPTSVYSITVSPHQTETLTYAVVPSKRGEYRWGQLYVRQLGPWGLAWQQWKVAQSQTVEVYPDLVGLQALSIRLTLQATGNIRQARRMGMGTEFAELREYATGDDPRLIDWKATARRDRLLVRVLEPEQEQTLVVLLDRGRLMTAQVQGLARYDWGLNATLSLALAALHRGDRVGVGVFDRQMQVWVPPERGQRHLFRLIDQLTPTQPELLEPDYLAAVTVAAKRQTRRALVVLITDVIDATASSELLAAMGHLTARHLPFCVALRDPQIDRQAQTPTTAIADTYARAVALDLLTQRRLTLATLQQKGVLVLDAAVDQISDQLVDRYLQLKARNRL